jgi:hypothetical protein
MIYFIQSTTGGPIKIGTTASLCPRMQHWNGAIPNGLRILAVLDGGHDHETMIHKKFRHLRITGEWFEPGDDLLEFIADAGWRTDQQSARSIEDDIYSINEWIARHNKSVFSAHEIRRHFPRFDLGYRSLLLEKMENDGDIRSLEPPPRKPGKPGRSQSQRYEVLKRRRSSKRPPEEATIQKMGERLNELEKIVNDHFGV